jgi:23S rRNA (guanosine2251-2'-O)-methyltransferase
VKLNAKQLRITRPTQEEFANIERKPIYIVLDNVMDTYNIGSIFRLADAVAAQEIILCAGSETPPSSRIHKAAVGTEEWVPWRYEATAESAISKLKTQNSNLNVIAIEQDERAVSLSELSVDGPVAIVVGHETAGVSKEALDLADVIVEIPMFGVNKSLNVVVSTGIVLYKLLT